MKIETKEIYKCDHCNKLYQMRKWAEYHEKGCHKNPLNKRDCFDCENLGKKNIKVYAGYADEYGDESEIVISVFYCSKKNIFMHPPKSENKKNLWDLGDEVNHPMPFICNDKEGFLDCLEDSLIRNNSSVAKR